MIKLMIIGRRAPGRSRGAAQNHLRTIHGPMVVSPPADSGPMPSGYVQNHVFDGLYPAQPPQHAIERDLVTELWFDSADHMRASVSTPYYLANLKPDEPRFVDDSSVERLLVAEHGVKDGDRGPYKLFVMGDASIRDRALAWLGDATAIVENVAQPSPFGPPFAEIVFEGWFASRDAAATALDACAGFALAAREYSTDALRRPIEPAL